MTIPVVLAGQALPAGTLQLFGTQLASHTPVLTAATTNPTLGSPGQLQEGFWSQQAGWVAYTFNIKFGTSGAAAGSGNYAISLPVTPKNIGISDMVLGGGHIVDSSAPDIRNVVYHWLPGDGAKCRITADGIFNVANAAPWTWAASDELRGTVYYPGDF